MLYPIQSTSGVLGIFQNGFLGGIEFKIYWIDFRILIVKFPKQRSHHTLLQLELEDALEVAEVSKTESGKYIPRLGQEAIHKQKP